MSSKGCVWSQSTSMQVLPELKLYKNTETSTSEKDIFDILYSKNIHCSSILDDIFIQSIRNLFSHSLDCSIFWWDELFFVVFQFFQCVVGEQVLGMVEDGSQKLFSLSTFACHPDDASSQAMKSLNILLTQDSLGEKKILTSLKLTRIIQFWNTIIYLDQNLNYNECPKFKNLSWLNIPLVKSVLDRKKKNLISEMQSKLKIVLGQKIKHIWRLN